MKKKYYYLKKCLDLIYPICCQFDPLWAQYDTSVSPSSRYNNVYIQLCKYLLFSVHLLTFTHILFTLRMSCYCIRMSLKYSQGFL